MDDYTKARLKLEARALLDVVTSWFGIACLMLIFLGVFVL